MIVPYNSYLRTPPRSCSPPPQMEMCPGYAIGTVDPHNGSPQQYDIVYDDDVLSRRRRERNFAVTLRSVLEELATVAGDTRWRVYVIISYTARRTENHKYNYFVHGKPRPP